MKTFLLVLFWLWGIIGFLGCIGQFAGLGTTIGVGASSYLSACALLWIGGLLLFGLGAIAVPAKRTR